MKHKPSFPAIQIFINDNIIYGCENYKDYYRSSLSLMNKLKGSVLIDCEGTKFVVKDVKKVGWGTILWGYNPLMKGRLVKVDFEYAEVSKLSWHEFKNIILDKLGHKTNPIWYPNSKKMIIDNLTDKSEFKSIIDLFLYEK